MSNTRKIEEAPNYADGTAKPLEYLPKNVLEIILGYIPRDVKAVSEVSKSLNIRVDQLEEDKFIRKYQDALPLLASFFRKKHVHISAYLIDDFASVFELLPIAITSHIRIANDASRYFYQRGEEVADLVLSFPLNLQDAEDFLEDESDSYNRKNRIIVMFVTTDNIEQYQALRKTIPNNVQLVVENISDTKRNIITAKAHTLDEKENKAALLAQQIRLAIKAALKSTGLLRVKKNDVNEWEKRLLEVRKKKNESTGLQPYGDILYQEAVTALFLYDRAKAYAEKNHENLPHLTELAYSWPKYNHSNYPLFSRTYYLNAKSNLIKYFIEFGIASKYSSNKMAELSVEMWYPVLDLVNTLIITDAEWSGNQHNKYMGYAKQMNEVADLLITLKIIISKGPTSQTMSQVKKQIAKVENGSNWFAKHSDYFDDEKSFWIFIAKISSLVLIALAVIAVITLAVVAPPIFLVIPCSIILLSLAGIASLKVKDYHNESASAQVATVSKATSAFFTACKKQLKETKPQAVSDVDNSLKNPLQSTR